MKVLLIFAAIILISTSLHADPNKFNQVHKYQRIGFCTDYYYYEDDTYAEYRQACFSLGEDANNEQTDVAAYIRCKQDEGTCDGNYRAYCQTDKAGPGVIQVANKTQIIVDIQPEDCDFALNSIGSQFSATANGMVKERFDYGNYFLHAYQLDRQCILSSKGGSRERQSVDVEAVIEGKAVVGTASIYTTITDSLHNRCPLPW